MSTGVPTRARGAALGFAAWAIGCAPLGPTGPGPAQPSAERVATGAAPSVPDRANPHAAVKRRDEVAPPEPTANWSVVAAHSFGLLSTMRVTEAWLWPQPFANLTPAALSYNYERAFTRPPKWDATAPAFEWDGDRWQINVLGHGLLGSELYLRTRSCGFGVALSLASAAVTSSVWEYGFEASGVQPSGMDLWFTPLSGLVFGEARYQAYRWSLARRSRSWIRWLVDPLGTIERAAGTPC